MVSGLGYVEGYFFIYKVSLTFLFHFVFKLTSLPFNLVLL